jgi:CNT family concentrative nucleoside transporter
MSYFAAILGVCVFIFLAYLFSTDKKSIDWALVIKSLVLQLILAFLVLGVPAFSIKGPLSGFFATANDLVVSLLSFTRKGGDFVFGSLF